MDPNAQPTAVTAQCGWVDQHGARCPVVSYMQPDTVGEDGKKKKGYAYKELSDLVWKRAGFEDEPPGTVPLPEKLRLCANHIRMVTQWRKDSYKHHQEALKLRTCSAS